MRILAIETSCDETAVAIYCSEQGILAHELFSQIDIHKQYGGVVPELASRDHIRKTLPLIKNALKKSNGHKQIDGIAYTQGPGLIGSLMVGATIGASLAYAWQIPAIGIHHLEGHLLAPLLEERAPGYPFLALLVSGGHTLLVHVENLGKYQILGQSLDDACGEAFDKTAKLLGLGYPGGPAVAKLAQSGNPSRFRFPRPMTNKAGLDFSFSGLKTYARNTLAENDDSEQTKADIAYAFEKAVVDTLLIKSRRALKQTALKQLVVAGGVSANLTLRTKLQEFALKENIQVYYPRLEYCTDNAAMIALAGCLRLQKGQKDNLALKIRARWPIDEL